MRTFEREISVAREAAHRASQLVLRVYGSNFDVDYKGPSDPVTDADRGANALIVEALRAAFPDDHICAEEFEGADSSLAASKGGRCWFVDPLDGTREFVSKNGEFSVMIGLAIDGSAALGVVHAPAWNRELWGVVSEAEAFERGVDDVVRALRVGAGPAKSSDARLVASRSHLNPRVAHVAERLGIADVHPCGSVGLKCALVATAEADLYVHVGPGAKLWDGCAPEAIARAAGARFTDTKGRAIQYATSALGMNDGIVVGSAGVHAAALAALAEVNS